MASKKTSVGYSSSKVSNNELLDELASFLYDAYQHSKQKDSAKIEPDKGQIADDGDNS